MAPSLTEIYRGTVGSEWMAVSKDVFLALRTYFDLGDSWGFSLSSPDVSAEELLDERGRAAWALRRIQAVRFLLAHPGGTDDLRLVLEYLSGMTFFLHKVIDERHDDLGDSGIRRLATLSEQLIASLIRMA